MSIPAGLLTQSASEISFLDAGRSGDNAVAMVFEPFSGAQLIDLRRRWGQWRVYYLTEHGHTACLPASWTDVGSQDPFVQQSQGRAIARVEDLLELAKIIRGYLKDYCAA